MYLPISADLHDISPVISSGRVLWSGQVERANDRTAEIRAQTGTEKFKTELKKDFTELRSICLLLTLCYISKVLELRVYIVLWRIELY